MTRRIERVNNLIRQELSELLQRKIKEPRLNNLITITEVSSTHDLRYAKIFVSHMGSKEERRETLSVLNAASNFFRREMTRHLRLRRIPELSFHWDDSIERGVHIMELMDKLHNETADKL